MWHTESLLPTSSSYLQVARAPSRHASCSAAHVTTPGAGIGDDHHLRLYHTRAGDKKALEEAWHLPLLSHEPGLCLKAAGSAATGIACRPALAPAAEAVRLAAAQAA